MPSQARAEKSIQELFKETWDETPGEFDHVDYAYGRDRYLEQQDIYSPGDNMANFLKAIENGDTAEADLSVVGPQAVNVPLSYWVSSLGIFMRPQLIKALKDEFTAKIKSLNGTATVTRVFTLKPTPERLAEMRRWHRRVEPVTVKDGLTFYAVESYHPGSVRVVSSVTAHVWVTSFIGGAREL